MAPAFQSNPVGKTTYQDCPLTYKNKIKLGKNTKSLHIKTTRKLPFKISLFFIIHLSFQVGNNTYDWNEFQKKTEYKGEYHANHPVM